MTTARDTIIDALDIESFALCACGPKAQNRTAQGNALGLVAQNIFSPERAAQKPRVCFVAPLQGASSGGGIFRGAAPGCRVIALSARGVLTRGDFDKQSEIQAVASFQFLGSREAHEGSEGKLNFHGHLRNLRRLRATLFQNVPLSEFKILLKP